MKARQVLLYGTFKLKNKCTSIFGFKLLPAHASKATLLPISATFEMIILVYCKFTNRVKHKMIKCDFTAGN